MSNFFTKSLEKSPHLFYEEEEGEGDYRVYEADDNSMRKIWKTQLSVARLQCS